jgi:hypothetical protein
MPISNFDLVLAQNFRSFPQYAQEDARKIKLSISDSFQTLSIFPFVIHHTKDAVFYSTNPTAS